MTLSTRTRRQIAAAALTAAVAAASTFAAEPAAPATAPAATPQRSIDVAKVNERAAQAFAKADANGDGKITPTEFATVKPPGGRGDAPRAHHKRHGGMGPGSGMHAPTDAERAEFDAALFKALDTDGNGQISEAEFTKLHEAMRALMHEKMFARLDSNGDGVLTPDEFPPGPKRVSAMDTDGDGKVTRQEIRAAKQAPPATTN